MPKKEYIIDQKYFSSQKELLDYIQQILHKYPEGENLEFDDFNFVYDLLTNHERAEEKIGCGVESIEVRVNKVWGNNKCFFLKRIDGSETDFSINKCLRTVDSPIHKFKCAGRSAISDQVIEFREQYFKDNCNKNGEVICPIEKTKISRSQSHVDHEFPNTFDKIVEDFVRERNIDPSCVVFVGLEDGKHRIFFKDKELEREFSEYHRKKATLRILSKQANLRQKKK